MDSQEGRNDGKSDGRELVDFDDHILPQTSAHVSYEFLLFFFFFFFFFFLCTLFGNFSIFAYKSV